MKGRLLQRRTTDSTSLIISLFMWEQRIEQSEWGIGAGRKGAEMKGCATALRSERLRPPGNLIGQVLFGEGTGGGGFDHFSESPRLRSEVRTVQKKEGTDEKSTRTFISIDEGMITQDAGRVCCCQRGRR